MAERAAGPAPRPCGVAELPRRGRVRCSGYVQALTLVPASEPPRFTAYVEDAPSAPDGPSARAPRRRVRLVWIGQRRISGIEAGTLLAFEGMVSTAKGLPTIYNPRYEILGRPEGTA
ncbi:hypothetical protein BN1051_01217 [Arthrobacter saudimassiliensis]|uniref:Uncharacterized protein n=1 Tax=Arthrobacter saudimassiliensis TaxID=1461584 RepID=A0A078MSV1_9MICC|nr:hypothetical protein BN1051_01217 [Arthrobacter saudimassiliensis]